MYVQGRGERSEGLELGELCGESVETRQIARTQAIRKPWKAFIRQMQRCAKSSALSAGL